MAGGVFGIGETIGGFPPPGFGVTGGVTVSCLLQPDKSETLITKHTIPKKREAGTMVMLMTMFSFRERLKKNRCLKTSQNNRKPKNREVSSIGITPEFPKSYT